MSFSQIQDSFGVLFLSQSRGLTRLEYVLYWGFVGLVFLTLIFVAWLALLRTQRLQATRELLHELADEKVRNLRSWVLDEMPKGSLNSDDHAKARRVAVSVDRMGFLIRQHLINELELFRWQQDELKGLLPKLEPIVTSVRQNFNRTHYCIYHDYLAKEWIPKMERKLARRNRWRDFTTKCLRRVSKQIRTCN